VRETLALQLISDYCWRRVNERSFWLCDNYA